MTADIPGPTFKLKALSPMLASHSGILAVSIPLIARNQDIELMLKKK